MNNLAFHKARPMTSLVSLADVPAGKIMEQIPNFCASHEKVQPETAAISFYLQNHAWGLVQLRNNDHENLNGDGEVARRYHEDQHDEIIRMFYYLILICTRESRHMKHTSKKTSLMNKYPKLQSFHATYVNDTHSMSQIEKTCNNLPDVTFGEYTNFLVDAFKCGYSGGFGGGPWRVVAECLREFSHGHISAEMMMDTAFTLAHNNGPIFNKGMLYHMYSNELIKILDVQASGQIPQFVAGAESQHIGGASLTWNWMLPIIGPEFEGDVDWEKVNANAKGGHHYGTTAKATIKPTKAKMTNTITSKMAEKAKMKTHLLIIPGVWVKKLSRKEVHA